MKQMIQKSELILNEDGSIYHLQLHPGDVAETIITVGDPNRVDAITKHFDSIRIERQRREFKTVTGQYKGKDITVISTGIGTDNIDIVFNEIDALFNIDFNTRENKENLTSLEFIRIGTSGAIQQDLKIDSFILSAHAIGLDGLLSYYHSNHVRSLNLESNFKVASQMRTLYAVSCDPELMEKYKTVGDSGITITADGFYGPQSRNIRLKSKYDFVELAQNFAFEDLRCTNLEMETSGIYGLAKMLGHRAISLNAILANRVTGEFSSQPDATINKLIEKTLELI